MDIGPSTGLPSLRVGEQNSVDVHEAQQVGLGGPNAAPHTRAQGTSRNRRRAGRVQSNLSAQTSTPPSFAASVAASERMSMRHPVSRAASRAF